MAIGRFSIMPFQPSREGTRRSSEGQDIDGRLCAQAPMKSRPFDRARARPTKTDRTERLTHPVHDTWSVNSTRPMRGRIGQALA